MQVYSMQNMFVQKRARVGKSRQECAKCAREEKIRQESAKTGKSRKE